MKIGIVTYHHVVNDGAVLQAHAQQQALQRLFPEAKVDIIDFRYKLIERRERFDVLKDVLKLRKSAYSKLRKYMTVRSFINHKLVLSDRRFVSDDMTEVIRYINDNYQLVVTGSDEVWKIDYKRFSRPFPNIYWLPAPIKAIKVGAAATANTLNVDKLREGDKQHVKELLSAFSLIGSRDQFTHDFVKQNTQDVPAYIMPDPTFALQFDDQVRQSAKAKLVATGIDLTKPAMALSLSSNIRELRELSEAIFAAYSAKGYQIVSIGQYNAYCHFNLTAQLDPLEWAHVYKFFDFCITDRFHSTIFSIRNHVNFVSIDFSDRYKGTAKGKIHDLLGRISMLDHHINLKNHGVQEAVKKTWEIREKGVHENMPETLRQVDQRLADEYNNFVQKIKALIPTA